jgi:hypothetical protein
LDEAEQKSMIADLPVDQEPGVTFIETVGEIRRVWLRVLIIAGSTGGRWAYWASWKDPQGRSGVGAHPQRLGIADKIFNGDAAHFIGMLGVPHQNIPGTPIASWVLVEPKAKPPVIRTEFEEKPKIRYEKSKDVYDVNTQTSTELP